MPDPLPREVLVERRLQRALIELGNLRSMNKKLLRSGGLDVEGVVEEIRKTLREEKLVVLDPIKFKRVKLRQEVPVKTTHKESAALAWSDWHLSEKVKSSDSNGINNYDSVVAANRVWELVQKQKKIVTLHQSMYEIERVFLSVLGDMVSGSIHEELRLTNDLTDTAASVLCARILQMAISELKTLNVPIKVDTVIGNHPRLTKMMGTKAQAMTNLDWLIYEMVGESFKNDEQVKFTVHTGQLAIVDYMGWRYVLEHGIDWKNSREEDFEDKIRALFDDPTYREATGLKGSSFDQIVIGNLHKPAFLERTVKNGALVGQNELGQAWRLKPIKAGQVMWGISNDHVRTWDYFVDVTSVKNSKGDNPFGDYAEWFVKKHGR